MGTNITAFLDMLAVAEIGYELMAVPEAHDGYKVLVGSTPAQPLVFVNYQAHPLVGQPIQYAPGVYSTAAGRYQILDTFWPHYKRQLSLPDFSPESQDAYAIQQIREQDAYDPLLRGDLRTAIGRCANIWASLPGNSYGQHTHEYAYLRGVFEREGGSVR